MIATLSEVKTLLQITNSTYDTFISAILPKIEGIIFSHCNNHFCNPEYDYISSAAFKFYSSDNSIYLPNIDTDYELAVGDTIRIYGSLKNDRWFTITSFDTDKIIVQETIKDETNIRSIYLTLLSFPEELKQIVADMVRFKIEFGDKQGVASEKIDDYTVTFSTYKDFPDGAFDALINYKYPYTKDIYSMARW